MIPSRILLLDKRPPLEAFSISRLPPGTYVIEAWHERLPAQTQTVTVGAHETKTITFTFHS